MSSINLAYETDTLKCVVLLHSASALFNIRPHIHALWSLTFFLDDVIDKSQADPWQTSPHIKHNWEKTHEVWSCRAVYRTLPNIEVCTSLFTWFSIPNCSVVVNTMNCSVVVNSLPHSALSHYSLKCVVLLHSASALFNIRPNDCNTLVEFFIDIAMMQPEYGMVKLTRT